MSLKVYILTDMEGIAGIDEWDQVWRHDPTNGSPKYQVGRRHLTLDTNAAIAGAFDAGATEVLVLDGHGHNRNNGFIPELFESRARKVWLNSPPVRLEGVDESVDAIVVVGQHAMAGTINAFLDHTQQPKEVCRFKINGQEHGELSQLACYAGFFDVPIVHASGDEALCAEARRLFPWIRTTPTKQGIGWDLARLYPPEEVRKRIRRDVAEAIRTRSDALTWELKTPIEVETEWAWSGAADVIAAVPGVTRLDARTVRWKIDDPRDIYTWPSEQWSPSEGKMRLP